MVGTDIDCSFVIPDLKSQFYLDVNKAVHYTFIAHNFGPKTPLIKRLTLIAQMIYGVQCEIVGDEQFDDHPIGYISYHMIDDMLVRNGYDGLTIDEFRWVITEFEV
jgi:hypothetical protein